MNIVLSCAPVTQMDDGIHNSLQELPAHKALSLMVHVFQHNLCY